MKFIKSFVIFLLLLDSIVVYSQNYHAIDSLKGAISRAEFDTLKISLLNDLSVYYNQVSLDSGIYFLEKALDIARSTDSPMHKARTFANIGGNYCFKGEYLKSLEFLDLAFNIAEENEIYWIQAYTHYIRSIVFTKIDNLHQAIEEVNKAYEIYTRLEKKDKLASLFTMYSFIYESLGDQGKSLEYARKAYKSKIEMNDIAGIASMANNLGANFMKSNVLDSAYHYLWESIEINRKNGFKNSLAGNYGNLVELKFRTNEMDSATFYLDEALSIYNEIGYYLEFYTMLTYKANIAMIKGDTASTIIYYDSIINSGSDIEGLKNKINAYKSLYEIARAQNRFDQAFRYFESYKIYDDSLKKETNTSFLSVLEMQVEYEKQSSQLKMENNEIKMKSQRKTFLLIIMCGLILLLGITSYLVLRLQRTKAKNMLLVKERIEEELDFKKREMTASVMALMKKNEILSGISKKLSEIEYQAVREETREAVSKISVEIRKSMDVELWEEFIVRFQQVHQDFYDHLIHAYPDLSPNEQRMCAFLRMNMSTKDISELTGLDTRTVDNTRYRIRKKLNLDGKTNLVSFLSKI